jgi:tRNA(Ile)-lysidine synthase
VLRPFLEIAREQIDEYVSVRQVPYTEDPTNVDTSFVRNRVRHEVLPLLTERFDPSIVWILAEQARSLAQDSEALRLLARSVADELGDIRESDPDWLERFRGTLQGLAPAIRWRVVQTLCTGRLGFAVGEARATAMLRVISGDEPAIDLGDGLSFECSSNGLRFVSR